MSSNPLAQNGSASRQHVNTNLNQHSTSNRPSVSQHPSHISSTPKLRQAVSNGHAMNGQSHQGQSALAFHGTIADKHKVPSPHKLMIGVPPASTPRSAELNPAFTNGTSHHHLPPAASSPDTSVASLNGHSTANSKGKQKQINLVHDIPLSSLEQELPLEEADLVPLAALVERLANFGYETLQNLAETLPSLPSSSKRAKIFNSALDVRKQFIKLLVLARWSTDVADLQKARNIISLLSEQQWQHEDIFAGLSDVRKILPNARMRNADLPTAIDVLRTATYQRLPTSIKDMAVAPKPFTDTQALKIVARLEDVLRTRMLCSEIVPAPLSEYTIHDGKVHFRVRGLFEAQLTASGDGSSTRDPSTSSNAYSLPSDPDLARWWLLDLKFDIAATGSSAASTIKLFPRKPKKAYLERLRIWGDQELAPRPHPAHPPEEPPADQSSKAAATETKDVQILDDQRSAQDPVAPEIMPNPDQSISSPVQRDVPLVRLFAFLQERSLHYQLDILQHQAQELCRLNWGSNLRIETSERPRCLILHYWTHAQSTSLSISDANASSQRTDGPAAGGTVRISIVDLDQQEGANKTVAELLHDEDDDQGDQEAAHSSEKSENTNRGFKQGSDIMLVRRRGLQVVWDADPLILKDSDTHELSISAHHLDVEALLSSIVQKHTAALLRYLQRRILIGEHQVSRLLRPEDCILCKEASARIDSNSHTAAQSSCKEFLRIDLQGRSRQPLTQLKDSCSVMPPLRLHVDPTSGRLLLEVEENTTTTNALASGAVTASSASGFTAPILTARPALARLAEASDRINASVENILDVLHRLEIFARVEEWERKASYVGLRSVRKLNFRLQELAKFGPSIAVNGPPLLFLPLGNNFPSYYLALQPSELVGVSIALICVAQIMDSTGTASPAVQSIEWLDRVKIASATLSRRGTSSKHLGKRKRVSGAAAEDDHVADIAMAHADQQLGRGDLSFEELSSIHSYSVALVSYFRVEQQLRMRGIPYLHVGSTTSRPSPSVAAGDEVQAGHDGAGASEIVDKADASESGVQKLVPTLCLRAGDLLGPAKGYLAKPSVALRVSHWDDMDRMCVQILIKLRMKSRRLQRLHAVVAYGSGEGDKHSVRPRTWIEFDHRTAILIFSTKDLDNCIPSFQMQWERVARMFELAREVLNASRAWQQRALLSRTRLRKPKDLIELKRFTFSDVVFSYGSSLRLDIDPDVARRLLVRVRWQDPKIELSPYSGMPIAHNGGYIVEFGSIPLASASTSASFSVDDTAQGNDGKRNEDPAGQWFLGEHARANPHNAMAFELRRTVNVAARAAMMASAALINPSMAHPGVANRSAPVFPSQQPQHERMVWRGFFQLLTNTLPLIREVQPLLQKSLDDADSPELEIKAATWFRLRFLDRYALDIRIASQSRMLLCDASQPLFRSPVKGLSTSPSSPTSKDGAGGDDAIFSGSQLLDAVSKGQKIDKGAIGSSSAYSQSWTLEQSTHQFLPLPNFERIVRQVVASVNTTDDDALKVKVGKVWDLRRAILVSVGPQEHSEERETRQGENNDQDGQDSDHHLLHNILPLLIDKIKTEIGSAHQQTGSS